MGGGGGGRAVREGRPDVRRRPHGGTGGRRRELEVDPAGGTLTVRLGGGAHQVFTGLGGDAWCPVITMFGEGYAVEVLPFSPSGAYPA